MGVKEENCQVDKLIMVVAGSYWQIPIIEKIKQMGYRTLVVNLHEDSPAFEFADYYEVADIMNIGKCLEIALKYKVDAVLSEQTDIAVPTVAYIAEKLGKPSIGKRCANLYSNKALMRDFGKKNNLVYPDFAICYSQSDLKEFSKRLKRPYIIKPLDSNSSRGVFIIENDTELKSKFESSVTYSRAEKAVIAEQYINGTEFTVDGIKNGEKHITLAISEKKHYQHNNNIAYELFFSNYNESYSYNTLKSENDKFIELSNLPDGCLTHAEYKYEDNKFYLIEIGARGGGNLVASDIVPIMSGVDNYKYLVNASLGITNEEVSANEELKDRCSVLYFFDTPGDGGVVKEIKGLDLLKNSKNITKFKLNFKVGDRINKPVNDAARVGFYIAYAESKQELLNIQKQIELVFEIIYE